MRTLVLVLMVLFNSAVLIPRSPHYGPVANDDEFILPVPMAYVDLAVLENDYDPRNDVNLRVISLTHSEDSDAQIIDGRIVRVYLNWSGAYDPGVDGLVAHGTYIVSNGLGKSEAHWSVWYFPEITI